MGVDNGEFNEGQRGAEQIDLVAEPIRYPRSPLVALVLIALIPSIGFFALYRWADSEASQYEDSRDVVAVFDAPIDGGLQIDGVLIEPDAVEGDSDGTVATTTQLFDYRRAPAAVASVASAGKLQGALEPVLSFIGADSCAAVAVGGVLVASSNLDLPVIPASNQKLLVAFAALDVLGPDYRFTTSVAVPPVSEGVVAGDIYLIGGGDPLLTSDDYPTDDDQYPAINTTSFDELVDVVVQAGVTRIRGTVIGDGTRYDDEFAVEEWAEGIAFNDAGPYDALLANDSRGVGRSGRLDAPTTGAAREFARLLGNAGIRVDNGWGSGVASTLVPVTGSIESAPLADVVAEMLLTSDNNTAEMLLKEMGVATTGQGTRLAGIDAMVASLTRQGVPMEGIVAHDGSGLSNLNRVTCVAILEVIQLGAGGPIDDGVPIAGESGTLASEFVDHSMAGRLRAKTGTLNNEPFDTDPHAVKALAGYVDPQGFADAGTIQFVLIANTPNVTEDNVYRPLWSALGERFATYPNGPPQDSLGPR
jgi:D-alanyl-D-alanine carboxypeptidase/D-alanyl-D-alanine-endopeptidase (penicillin-binding protein 4)